MLLQDDAPSVMLGVSGKESRESGDDPPCGDGGGGDIISTRS